MFYIEARASQAACTPAKHFEARGFHPGTEESTSLETLSDFSLPELLISISKIAVKNKLCLEPGFCLPRLEVHS